MNKLEAGVRMLVLSAAIQCTKYISAAIYMSGSPSQSRELFRTGLQYVGPLPDIASAAAAVAGVLLLVMEFIEMYRKKFRKEDKTNEKDN